MKLQQRRHDKKNIATLPVMDHVKHMRLEDVRRSALLYASSFGKSKPSQCAI